MLYICAAYYRPFRGPLLFISIKSSFYWPPAFFFLHAEDKAVDTHTHTHTHPFNGPLSGTTRVSRYQKGKTNLDFTEARDTEWQWHQLGHMQVCTALQTDNHASTPPLSFLQAGCPSCRPSNSVKALKAVETNNNNNNIRLHPRAALLPGGSLQTYALFC